MEQLVPPGNGLPAHLPRKRDWFLIIVDASIVAVHLLVVAGIVTWLIGSAIHANLLGWIVVSTPIMGLALAVCGYVVHLAMVAEADPDNR